MLNRRGPSTRWSKTDCGQDNLSGRWKTSFPSDWSDAGSSTPSLSPRLSGEWRAAVRFSVCVTNSETIDFGVFRPRPGATRSNTSSIVIKARTCLRVEWTDCFKDESVNIITFRNTFGAPCRGFLVGPVVGFEKFRCFVVVYTFGFEPGLCVSRVPRRHTFRHNDGDIRWANVAMTFEPWLASPM